ncbi:hypothetical protein EI761_20755 [Salmonella enterica]|nr:hypothetical protein [Salmonella enterica]
MQQGGNAANPRERRSLRDRGARGRGPGMGRVIANAVADRNMQEKDKKRPLLKLQGPGTSKHHIGRHDATVKIIWPDGEP